VKTAFFRYLRKALIDAFTSHAASPESVVRVLAELRYRPCGVDAGAALEAWLREHEIERLVHFTRLENVCSITRYGLIPRDHLNLDVVKLVVGPRFSDDMRLDGMVESTCLSLTSANYKMFYRKRQFYGSARWAVLEIDPRAMTRFFFTFTPTNAARFKDARPGREGAERMFMAPAIRHRLGLRRSEPTDPQSEALVDSVIGPEYLKRVWVECEEDRLMLHRAGVKAAVGSELFRPRRDFEFWSNRTILDLEIDGQPVMTRRGVSC